MIATRAKATALVAVLQLMAATAWAQQPGIDSLFPAQPVGYVNDFASVIDPQSEQEMDDLIRRLSAATGAEIAVVTLSSIGDREASEVALEIGRTWKVGSKADVGDPRRNAGVVLLLVPRQAGQPNSGQIRIETGQGVEGFVTDAAAGRIRDLMRPDLSAERYGPGLLNGVRALSSLIARGYGVSDSTLTSYQPVQDQGGGSSLIANIFPILLFVVFMWLTSRGAGGRRRRRGVYWGGPWIGGGWGGGGGFGGGGGGFGGFGGGGGFSGGGAGGRF